jgi:hypothetical protein
MEEVPLEDDIIIHAYMKGEQNKNGIRVRYGDIKYKTNTMREYLAPMIESAVNRLRETGISKIGQEMLADSPSWESTPIPPYIPYSPYIPGYTSSFDTETNGRTWKCVFLNTTLTPITRPISGWPSIGSNMLGVPKNGSMYINNRFRPSCRCTKIQFTGIYYNLGTVEALAPANVANNGDSFFVVPQNALVKQKWQMYKRSGVYGKNNAVDIELIAEWCTFDEMCTLAHEVEFGTASVAASTTGNITGIPTIFVAQAVGGLNVTQTKYIRWTWNFPTGIILKNTDFLIIVVGETLNAAQVVGSTNLKNLTAMAYFEKIDKGLDTQTANNLNLALIIIP